MIKLLKFNSPTDFSIFCKDNNIYIILTENANFSRAIKFWKIIIS